MSTKVQKFHLSSECRYILYRLRLELDFLLDKDIVDGFPCATRSLGHLLPLLYVAFVKIWCGKIPLVVKKPFRSYAAPADERKILINYDDFERLRRDSAAYRDFCKDASEYLPF